MAARLADAKAMTDRERARRDEAESHIDAAKSAAHSAAIAAESNQEGLEARYSAKFDSLAASSKNDKQRAALRWLGC